MALGVDDIDELLSAPKSLVGEPVWTRNAITAITELAAPILVEGLLGGLTMRASASLTSRPQRGSCVLVLENRPITRMSIKPSHSHSNPFARSADPTLRGLTLPPDLTRLHAWNDNRAWPRPPTDNLPFAKPFDIEPASFAEALTIFLGICQINGNIPPPPWEPLLL